MRGVKSYAYVIRQPIFIVAGKREKKVLHDDFGSTAAMIQQGGFMHKGTIGEMSSVVMLLAINYDNDL